MQPHVDDARLKPVLEKVRAAERLTYEDGLALYRSPDILAVGYMANLVRERMHGPRARPLVVDGFVPPGDAIEPIRGMQPEHIGDRMPLDDVSVDVERISTQLVAGARPIRHLERRAKLLGRGGLGGDGRRQILARERSVPLSRDERESERSSERQGGDSKQETGRSAHPTPPANADESEEQEHGADDAKKEGHRRGRCHGVPTVQPRGRRARSAGGGPLLRAAGFSVARPPSVS